jgi:CheY-like chemotaxis protein
MLQLTRVDLNRIVAAAVESCLPQAQARGHQLALHLTAAALPLDADAVRLEQIVCNLVSNAVKFTAEPGEIRIATWAEDGQAFVAVEDRGIGFDPERATQIFAPFVQASTTLARTTGGLGIGLTIVQRLAEMHGGAVSASSAGPGKGARFTVRLPLASVPAAAQAQPAPVAPGARRRVLVIEDNDDIRESLRLLLELCGHDAETAADGTSGLRSLLAAPPDVALIDIGLPGLNGYDVARALRARLPHERVRLVAVTGYGQDVDRERALAAGFDGHLLKPITLETLERELAL